jgi:hypothetical protein
MVVWQIVSAFRPYVRLFESLHRRGRFTGLPGALSPNVTSQTRRRKQQRRERGEKGNQKPAHGTNSPKNNRERLLQRLCPRGLRDSDPICAQAGLEPRKIGAAASLDCKHQKLWRFVAV